MADRLLSPSKITAWLDCGHYLTLRERVDAGLLEVELAGFGSFARLLADKGSQHEAECLEHYRAEGRSIYEVPAREPGERFDDWVARVGTPWDDGFDVIYQMPFVHDGMRGIADFLVQSRQPVRRRLRLRAGRRQARPHARPSPGTSSSSASTPTPSAPRPVPRRSACTSGSGRGEIESLATKEFRPYWSRLRNQLRPLLEDDAPLPETRPDAVCPLRVLRVRRRL